SSTPFPYTTLFRSNLAAIKCQGALDGTTERIDVVGRSERSAYPFFDHLRHRATAVRGHRAPGHLRLRRDQPERLLPPHRADGDGAARHHGPELAAGERTEVLRLLQVDLILGIVEGARHLDAQPGFARRTDR